MEYKHINDCWNALEDAKTVEEVEDLFDDFPRWSGDWDWYVENGEVVVENTYYDDYSEVYETDSRTFPDIPVDEDEGPEFPWDYK